MQINSILTSCVLLLAVSVILSVRAEKTISFDFSESSRILVIEKLKETFYLLNLMSNYSDDAIRSSLSLKQSKLLGMRNSNCSPISTTLSDLKELNASNHWRNMLDAWRSLDSTHDDSLKSDYLSRIVTNFDQMCLDSSILYGLFRSQTSQEDTQLRRENYQNMYEILLSQLTNSGCNFCPQANIQKSPGVTQLQTWGYGILLVTIISLSSLCGALVIPFSKKKFYKKILMFLIALAVGSLSGSGFLHLIPQAFGITDDENYAHNHDYVWKGLVIMCGVYLFYVVEKILKFMILNRKHKRKMQAKNLGNVDDRFEHDESWELREQDESALNDDQAISNQQMLQNIAYVKTREKPADLNVEMRTHLDKEILAANRNFKEKRRSESESFNKNHGHSHLVENLSTVEPVAWMIIFGDGLHNFIDGLSIGAAFTDSILKGISISLAVICEEFPHELGDFAILINAGMSFRNALLFNFLSACSCYLGLAVGIILGDNLNANKWIYAIAGGMFLYISLCDMIPELNELGDEIEKDYHESAVASTENNSNVNGKRTEQNNEDNQHMPSTGSGVVKKTEDFNLMIKLKISVIQNIGVILGFSIMMIMAIHSENISL